jgi:hypothetical protein
MATADLQVSVLRQVLPLATGHPHKVIVLHLWDETLLGEAGHQACLAMIREFCGEAQPIHLHCFHSSERVVEEWVDRFRNCHFRFAGGGGRREDWTHQRQGRFLGHKHHDTSPPPTTTSTVRKLAGPSGGGRLRSTS